MSDHFLIIFACNQSKLSLYTRRKLKRFTKLNIDHERDLDNVLCFSIDTSTCGTSE